MNMICNSIINFQQDLEMKNGGNWEWYKKPRNNYKQAFILYLTS